MLSRYNADPLCGPCMQAVRESGLLVPSWLWDSEPMRRALASLDLAAVVAIVRAATGLSQMDLANLVTGWSQSTVSLIERRRRDTLYDVRELLRFADAIALPREALLPLLLGDPDATLEVDDGVELAGVSMELDRRTFNGLAAGAAVSLALPAHAYEVPDQVDAAHVRYLRACVARLRSRDQNIGGGAILRQAISQFGRARKMLDESDYSESIGRQLLQVAADAGLCAGWLAYDHGDQTLARRLYAEAELLASSSGDAELAVHVYANMAMQSTHLARTNGQRGLAREALRLAQRARDAAHYEPSPRLKALIGLRQATAHAQLGDEVAFRSSITAARHALDRGPHPADPSWAVFVTPAEVTGHEGMGLVRLGSPAHAAALFRDVLDDSAVLPRNRACYQAYLAGALFDEGDRNEAITQGLEVLSVLGGDLTSGRPLDALEPVRAAAEQSSAEEFCVRFDAARTKIDAA